MKPRRKAAALRPAQRAALQRTLRRVYILLFADGEANQPRFNQPCNYANTRATTAKAADITVFTLGYGASSARCQYDTTASPFGPEPTTRIFSRSVMRLSSS